MWFTAEDYTAARQAMIRWSPAALLALLLLLIGFGMGYNFKGDEIVKDCKYANAFREGVDSFNCSRKI